MKTICVVPARGGSKRLFRKNLALLSGRPLLSYTLEAACECGLFDKICVSTEDEEIAECALRHGGVDVLKRPSRLASDSTTVFDVCLHVLDDLESQDITFDVIAVLLATSPLRSLDELREGHSQLMDGEMDGVMSLTPYSHPPQRAVWAPRGWITPYYGHKGMTRTQKLDRLYRHDGAFIYFRIPALRRNGSFYGERVAPYFVHPDCSVDIDNPIDLRWAEFLLEDRKPQP